MSIKLEGPYPGVLTTTFLPNPTFGDSEAGASEIDVHYAMTGKRRVYVEQNSDRELVYSFRLKRKKALELRAFILNYFAKPIRLTNHDNEVWVVRFTSNPFDFAANRKWTDTEEIGITLQFRGYQSG